MRAPLEVNRLIVDCGTEGEKNVSEREEKIPSLSSIGDFGWGILVGSVLHLIIVGFSCV